MKARNYHYYGDEETVKRIAEEYVFIGRHIKVEPGHVTVLAYPPVKPTKKKVERARDEDEAKTNRRPQRREQASKVKE